MPESKVEAFLTAEEEREVIDAILEAETNTSGEIRVHIERGMHGDHLARAKEVFHRTKMDNTRDRNGVLFYVAVEDRKFVVFGDEGINNVVPKGFWDQTRDIVESAFKKGQFKQGLVDGILNAGEELKDHFPWTRDDDNELSDEISRS